ncbi:MAG: class I SAM-dependent methyltransferase, partial [Gammaproteobacteria bacterium]|nr:class I SAM-dependent methyltransferase [Gammaproteobacteria bacterium]
MNMPNTPISISYSSDNSKENAINFSKITGYPCVLEEDINTALNLNFTSDFVELRDMEKNISIHIDFISGNLAHRQQFGGGRGQSIAKAIGLKQGVKPPTVIDATAGLAKDAYVLSCLGCPITLLERSPVIVELIKDAIHRAEEDEHFQTILKTGFNVIAGSSIEYLTTLLEQKNASRPDVIYLDPMYPHRKKSASVKKNMQILQKLLGQDDDTQKLLDIALKVAKKRVVVKRPKGAENLTNIKPTYLVESKKTRYDVYIIAKEQPS